MSKEPGFLKNEGEVLLEISRRFKREVVKKRCMSFIKTAKDFNKRGGKQVEGKSRRWK